MPTRRTLALSTALSLVVFAGCSSAPADEGAADEQDITSETPSARASEEALSAFRALMPNGEYAGEWTAGGFGCGIKVIQPRNIAAEGVLVSVGFYSGRYCPDCHTSPMGGFEFMIAGDATPISDLKSNDGTLSFIVDNEGTTAKVKLSDPSKPGASLAIEFKRPGGESTQFECSSLESLQ